MINRTPCSVDAHYSERIRHAEDGGKSKTLSRRVPEGGGRLGKRREPCPGDGCARRSYLSRACDRLSNACLFHITTSAREEFHARIRRVGPTVRRRLRLRHSDRAGGVDPALSHETRTSAPSDHSYHGREGATGARGTARPTATFNIGSSQRHRANRSGRGARHFLCRNHGRFRRLGNWHDPVAVGHWIYHSLEN